MGGFFIDMIDVGQGDAFLLTLTGNDRDYTFLIDGGRASDDSPLVDFIKANAGGRVDFVIGTHLDDDHIGGLKAVVEKCQVGHVYLNLPPDLQKTAGLFKSHHLVELFHKSDANYEVIEKSLETAGGLLDAVKKKGLVVEPILVGTHWDGVDVRFIVLNPTQERLNTVWQDLEKDETSMDRVLRTLQKSLGEEAPETTDMNNSGVVVEIIYQQTPYALLTADVGADVLKEVTRGKRYPFLKVSHHGSKTGLDEALAKQLRPDTAFIPVGSNNYGHPAKEVLEMLRDTKTRTYCSSSTDYCQKDCPSGGFGSLCHAKDRPFREGWSATDSTKCKNNRA
jgi:beta-lactamase superfamily II metal-dependent hydrolase